MTILVFYPNADHSIGLNYQYPVSGAHYSKLLTSDGDDSLVSNLFGSGWQYDVYRLSLFAFGTINSISITSIVRGSSGSASNVKLVTQAAEHLGTQRALSGSWTSYTDTWAVNPSTGVAWTIEDIVDWKASIGLYNPEGGTQADATFLSVTVDFTPYGDSYEILYPNGVGQYTQLGSQYPETGEHFDKVDEETSDDSATYVSTTSASYQVDTYALANLSSANALRINALIVFFRVLSVTYGGGGYAKPAFYTNSSLIYGSERVAPLSVSFEAFAQVLPINPVTGGAWTKAEINALQAGPAMRSAEAGYDTECTQLFVVVCHSIAPPAGRRAQLIGPIW
jgi:hypothetical protein